MQSRHQEFAVQSVAYTQRWQTLFRSVARCPRLITGLRRLLPAGGAREVAGMGEEGPATEGHPFHDMFITQRLVQCNHVVPYPAQSRLACPLFVPDGEFRAAMLNQPKMFAKSVVRWHTGLGNGI